jgi:hypothetical protein
VAAPGVTGKGNYGSEGILTTPVSVYFHTKEQIVFNIEIPHNLQLYKALNDDKAPQTQEDFMKEIIQANGTKLPQLPPGSEYVWDPAKEQLMVRHPAKATMPTK